MLIDRFRPFVENKKLKVKGAIIVAPCAEGLKACAPMLQMFRVIFDYVGIELLGYFFVKTYDNGDIIKNKYVLNRALGWGFTLSHFVPESTLYSRVFWLV